MKQNYELSLDTFVENYPRIKKDSLFSLLNIDDEVIQQLFMDAAEDKQHVDTWYSWGNQMRYVNESCYKTLIGIAGGMSFGALAGAPVIGGVVGGLLGVSIGVYRLYNLFGSGKYQMAVTNVRLAYKERIHALQEMEKPICSC